MFPPLLWKENPPDSTRGVDGSMRKEVNDVLHVKIGDAVPKLMSSFLVINEADNEPPPVFIPPKVSVSLALGNGVRLVVHA